MISPFLALIGIGLVGALTAPIIMLTLARFGLFEPIEFDLLGRAWRLAPTVRFAETNTNAITAEFYPRQRMFAVVVSGVLTVGPHLNISQIIDGNGCIRFGSASVSCISSIKGRD